MANLCPLVRTVFAEDATASGRTFAVDGSPWGGGGALWHRQVGPQVVVDSVPDQWLAVTWTAEDEELLGCRIGDPAGQATWEAFALLLCLREWAVGTWRGPLTIIGDAEGVMAGLITLGARSPPVNAIAREAVLLLAPWGRHLRGVHVWSEDNSLADALSRLAQGAAVPALLLQVSRAQVAPRCSSQWRSLGPWASERAHASRTEEVPS